MPSHLRTVTLTAGPLRLSGAWLLLVPVLYMIRCGWRFLITGRRIIGKPVDNATLLRPATKEYRENPRERLSAARWQRIARRWAVTGIPTALVLLGRVRGWSGPWWAPAARWFVLLGLTAGIVGAHRVSHRLLFGHLRVEFTEPAAAALCKVLGTPYRRHEASRLIELPRDFAAIDADDRLRMVLRWLFRVDSDRPARPVRVNLPADGAPTDPGMQRRIIKAVGTVLGMDDARADWRLTGRRPHVLLTPRVSAPLTAELTEMLPAIEAAPLVRPLIGMGINATTGAVTPVDIDYDNDSPHVLISGASGTGKSTVTRFIEAQRMRHGVGLIVADYKRVSHRWAHDLPGCLYAWRIADIHALLVQAGEELERRIANVIPEGADADTPLVQFQTIDVILEEMNSLSPQLQNYWQEHKPEGAPPRSPALAAVARLVNMGREYRMHVKVIGQRVSSNTLGPNGGDIRESFSTRLMAKWSTQTWKMLAGGLPYVRWPGGTRGVWAKITDDDVIFLRVPNLNNAEARALAMSGTPCPDTPLGALSGGHADTPVSGQPARPVLVTLSGVLDQLPGKPLALDALRKAASRDGNFPMAAGMAGNAKTYELAALVSWKMARDGADQLVAFESGDSRPGLIYAFDVIHPETGAVVVGYVGQTRRTISIREFEHRGDKPWGDTIVGTARTVWEGTATDGGLDARELTAIRQLRPLYNYEGQEGAKHAIPKWTAIEQRHARDAAAGRPAWVPEDRYVPGAR